MRVIASVDYYNARNKQEAIQFLKQFWNISALRKIPKRNILRMYHNKMREVLEKRGSYENERKEISRR